VFNISFSFFSSEPLFLRNSTVPPAVTQFKITNRIQRARPKMPVPVRHGERGVGTSEKMILYGAKCPKVGLRWNGNSVQPIGVEPIFAKTPQ